MTPAQQVVADATQTLQDACIAAGVPSPMDQLAAANAALLAAQQAASTITADVAALIAPFAKLRTDAGA